MAKPIKLNEDKLNAINSYADKLGRMYEDLAKMPNRIRKIAIGLSLDGSPEDNKFIKVGGGVAIANTIANNLDSDVDDEKYFGELEKAVDSKSDCVKLSVCKYLIEELDSDIAAKRKTIEKLEERICLSDDKNSAEVKVAKKRLEIFKNNLVIREGRKVRVLEYYFKLRYSLLKMIDTTTDGIVECLMVGDKYTQELSKRYKINPLLKQIAKKEEVFAKTKGE